MRMSSFIRRSHDMTQAEPPLRIEATVGRTMRLARLKRRITLIMTGRFDHILYALWVRFNRLDFAPASLEELGHSSERSVFHHTSGSADLAQVLRCLKIPKGSRALDLGSGKGGAACTLYAWMQVVSRTWIALPIFTCTTLSPARSFLRWSRI